VLVCRTIASTWFILRHHNLILVSSVCYDFLPSIASKIHLLASLLRTLWIILTKTHHHQLRRRLMSCLRSALVDAERSRVPVVKLCRRPRLPASSEALLAVLGRQPGRLRRAVKAWYDDCPRQPSKRPGWPSRRVRHTPDGSRRGRWVKQRCSSSRKTLAADNRR